MITLESSDLAAFLKVPSVTGADSHIAHAKALLEARVDASLDERDFSQTRLTPYDIPADMPFVFNDGPIAAITEVTFNGTVQTLSEFEVGIWTIRRWNGGLPKGTWVFDGVAGYNTDPSTYSLPDQIKRAWIGVASELWKRGAQSGEDLASEKLGDYSYTRRAANPFGNDDLVLGNRAAELIQKYRRPNF